MFSVNGTVSVQLNCQITATLSSDLKVWFKLAVTLPCLFECLRRSAQVSNNIQSYFFLEAAASCPQTSSSGCCWPRICLFSWQAPWPCCPPSLLLSDWPGLGTYQSAGRVSCLGLLSPFAFLKLPFCTACPLPPMSPKTRRRQPSCLSSWSWPWYQTLK